MIGSWDDLEVGMPLGKRNQGWSFQVPRLPNHEEAKPDQNQKKKMGKIQGVTNLPPLNKSHPQDLVAQRLNINIPAWGNHFQLGFPFCLCTMLPLDLIWPTTWLWYGLFHWILILTCLTLYIILTSILLCLLANPSAMAYPVWYICPSRMSGSCSSWTCCNAVHMVDRPLSC